MILMSFLRLMGLGAFVAAGVDGLFAVAGYGVGGQGDDRAGVTLLAQQDAVARLGRRCLAPVAPHSYHAGMRRIVRNWLERHRHPASRALHAVGIPLLIGGLLLGAWQLWWGMWPLWWRPLALILFSYVLQWAGHRIEGNDMGEVVLIKRMLGQPFVAVAPRCGNDEG